MDADKNGQSKEALLREYIDLAPTLAEFRHVSVHDAEDAIGKAVTRTLERVAAGLLDGSTLKWKPYIMTAAVNELKNAYRERKRLPLLRGKANDVALANHCDPEPTQASQVEIKELAARAWAEMEKLPEQQREVLTRRYRDGEPFSQIGAALGITASTARGHHRAGIEELRKRLWLPLCLEEIAWQWKKSKRAA